MQRKENSLGWSWGWVDVLRKATMRRRIMDISSSERGGNRSQSCYSTAINPRIAKRLSRRARGGFMNSVRRISLVGKHKRAQSDGVVPSSPALSGGGFFNPSSGGGKGADPPPLPYSLPNSTSQLSLRLPEESGSTFSLHQYQQPLNYPNLHLTSRRIVSASSGRRRGQFRVSFVNGVWRLWIRFWIAFAEHRHGVGWMCATNTMWEG